MLSNRGTVGEASVLRALVMRDFSVLIPFGEGLAYDLVIDVNGAFLRVQCKTAWQQPGALVFNAYSTDHPSGPGSYYGLADMFGVFYPPLDSAYLVPVGTVAPAGRLRLEPTKNKQSRRVTWAKDFEIDAWTAERLIACTKASSACAA